MILNIQMLSDKIGITVIKNHTGIPKRRLIGIMENPYNCYKETIDKFKGLIPDEEIIFILRQGAIKKSLPRKREKQFEIKYDIQRLRDKYTLKQLCKKTGLKIGSMQKVTGGFPYTAFASSIMKFKGLVSIKELRMLSRMSTEHRKADRKGKSRNK